MQFRIELAKCSAERTLSHAGRPAENYETSGLVRAHDLRFKGQEAIRRGKRGGSSEQIRNSEDPLLFATSVGSTVASLAFATAAEHAFAAIAGSVAGAAAPVAAFWRCRRSVAVAVGAPDPASVGVSDVPVP